MILLLKSEVDFTSLYLRGTCLSVLCFQVTPVLLPPRGHPSETSARLPTCFTHGWWGPRCPCACHRVTLMGPRGSLPACLKSEDPEYVLLWFQLQVNLLSKFLLIAKSCYEQRNFATAMQILGGLEHLAVRQSPVSHPGEPLATSGHVGTSVAAGGSPLLLF